MPPLGVTTLQVTSVLIDPVADMVASNCCVPPGSRVTSAGVTATLKILPSPPFPPQPGIITRISTNKKTNKERGLDLCILNIHALLYFYFLTLKNNITLRNSTNSQHESISGGGFI